MSEWHHRSSACPLTDPIFPDVRITRIRSVQNSVFIFWRTTARRQTASGISGTRPWWRIQKAFPTHTSMRVTRTFGSVKRKSPRPFLASFMTAVCFYFSFLQMLEWKTCNARRRTTTRTRRRRRDRSRPFHKTYEPMRLLIEEAKEIRMRRSEAGSRWRKRRGRGGGGGRSRQTDESSVHFRASQPYGMFRMIQKDLGASVAELKGKQG